MPEPHDHAERDAEIADLHARGFPTQFIAERYRLCDRHIRRILKAQPRPNAAFYDQNELERLSDLLAMHDSVIEDAALVARDASSPTVALSALETKLRAIDQKRCLLEEYGLLPHFEPPTWDGAYKLALAQTEVLRGHGAPRELEDELIDLIVRWHVA